MSSPYPLYLTPKNYCKIRSATRRHQSGHKVSHYHKGKYMLDVSKRPLRYYRQPPLAPSRPCSARPARAAEVGRRIYPGTRARRAARVVCGGVTRAPTPVCQRGLQSPSGRHPPAPPVAFVPVHLDWAVLLRRCARAPAYLPPASYLPAFLPLFSCAPLSFILLNSVCSRNPTSLTLCSPIIFFYFLFRAYLFFIALRQSPPGTECLLQNGRHLRKQRAAR